MRSVLMSSAAVALLLLTAASSAVAAGNTSWVGRGLDDPKVIWTCTNVSGDNWTLKRNGKVAAQYTGVTSTSEFVELQVAGTKSFDRLRLYKDKLSLNKSGTKTKWVQIAKGKWSN